MFEWLKGSAAGLVVLIGLVAGCEGVSPAPPVTPAPAAVANLVGSWQLESFRGQALPAGVTVTYRADGELEIQGHELPADDRKRIKLAMEEVGRTWGTGTPNQVKVNQTSTLPGRPPEQFEFQLQRN